MRRQQSAGNVDSSVCVCRCNACNFAASSVRQLELHAASAANSSVSSSHAHGVRILVALRHVLSTISRKIALHSGSHRESAVNTYCASSSSSPSTSLVTSSTFHCATSLDIGGASNLLISQQYRHPTITDYSSANPVSDNAPPPPALFNGDSEKKNDDGNLTQIINDKTGDNNSHKVNTVGEEVCQVQGETNVLETYAVDVPVLTSSSGEDSCLAFELLAKRRCWLKCALCSAFGLYDNNSSIWFGGDLNAFLKHIRNAAHITVERNFSSQVEENGLVRRSEGHTSQGYADLHQWIRRCVVISKCQNECFSSSDTGSCDDEHEAAEICVQSRHIRGSFASEEKVTAQPELRGSVRTTIAENCDKLTYTTSRLPAAGTLSSPRRPRTSSCASATQSDVASSTQADAGSDEVCVPLANNAISRQNMDNNVGYKSKRSYRHTLSPYNQHLPYVQSQSWCSKVAVGKRAKLDNGLRNCTEIGNFSGKTDNDADKPKIVTTIEQRSAAYSPLKSQPNQKHLVSTTARSASEPTLSGSAADYGLELVMQSLETSEISKSTLPAASHQNSTTPEISSPIDADTIRCSECNASLSTMWLLKAHVEECHGQNVVSSAKLAAFSTAVRQHSLNDLLAFLVPQDEETRTGSTKAKKHNLAGEYETNASDGAMSSSKPGFRVRSSSTKSQRNEKSASSQPLSSGDASISQFTNTPVPMASLQSTSSRTTKQANPPLLSAPVTSSSSLLSTASSTLLSSFLTTLFALPNHFASTERILSSAMSSVFNTTFVDGAGTNMASLLDHILFASAPPNIFQPGTNIREYAMAATEYQRRNLLGQMLQAAANPPASTTTSSSLLTQPENATLCGFAIPNLPASSDLTAVELRAAVVAAPSGRSLKPSAPSTASSDNPQQQKRARTRITDERLKVLRANFNINNSPNDEQYQNMCSSTLLPLKVVKHWFRNTLFKERQKNKDSPYNFSIPPLSSSSKLFENSDCELTRKETTWSHRLAAQQDASKTSKQSWRERIENSDSFPLPDENRGANLDDTSRVNYAECSAANEPQDFQISTETSAEDNASSCDSVADDERGGNVSRGRQTRKGKGIGSLLDRKRTPVSMSMFEVEIADGRDDFQAVGGEEDEEDLLVNEQNNYVLSNDDIVDLYYHGSSRRISSTSSDRGGDDGCDANIAKEAMLATKNSVAASCGPTADIVLCNMNDSLSVAKTNPLPPPPISDKTCPTPTTSTVFGASSLKFVNQHHTVGPFGGELVSAPTNVPNNSHSTAGSSKRANRTKFSEHQLKSLQDYFDKNPYPKDNDLEHLSTELKLAPRVITVWFQNQRQKARKTYGGSEGSGAIVSSSSSPSPTTSALSTPTSSYRSPSKPVLPGTKERTPEVLTAHTNVRSSSKSPTALNSATEYQCRVCVRSFRSYFELVKHHELHGSECCTISADKNGKSENTDGSFRLSSSSSTSERKRPTTMISTTADINNSSSSVINVPVQAEPCTKSTWQQAATDIVRKSPGAVCYGSFTHKNEEASRAFQAPPVTVPVKVKPSRGRASTLQPLSKPALGALRVTNSFRSSDEGIAENPEETTWNTQVNSLDTVSERQAQQQFQSTALSNLYSTLLNASAYGAVPLPIATVSAPQPTPAEGDPAGLLSSVPGQPISSAMQAVFASALRNTLIGSSGASNALAAAAQQYQQQLQSYNWLSCILQQSNSSFVSAALEQQQQQQQQQQAQLFGPASALLNALASSYAAAAVAAQAAHGPAMPATTTCPSSNLMPMNAGAVSAATRTISTLDSTSRELPEKIFNSSSTETLNNKHKRRRNYGHSPVTVATTHYSDVELRTSSDPVLSTINFSRDVRKVHHNLFDFTKNDDADGGETKSIEPEQNCGTMSAKHGINDNDEEMTDDGESSQLGASTSPALASNYNSATVARGGTSSKRVRTTILPEQYDFLFQQFKLDSNPSRTRLEFIANRAGLAKRVVQVWYQNTRARERKGTLNIAHQSINKRCPVCKVRFSARSALEQHLSTKHSDDVSRGTVSVDVLTDTDSEGPNEESIASISATE